MCCGSTRSTARIRHPERLRRHHHHQPQIRRHLPAARRPPPFCRVVTPRQERLRRRLLGRALELVRGGGTDVVANYLANLDLSGFDPKAPPPQTAAFWEIVNASRTPEDAELADVLDDLKWPDVVTIQMVRDATKSPGFAAYLDDRRNSRRIPHRFEACGYMPVRNPDAEDGLWRLRGRRQVVYAKIGLDEHQREELARKLAAAPPWSA